MAHVFALKVKYFEILKYFINLGYACVGDGEGECRRLGKFSIEEILEYVIDSSSFLIKI